MEQNMPKRIGTYRVMESAQMTENMDPKIQNKCRLLNHEPIVNQRFFAYRFWNEDFLHTVLLMSEDFLHTVLGEGRWYARLACPCS